MAQLGLVRLGFVWDIPWVPISFIRRSQESKPLNLPLAEDIVLKKSHAKQTLPPAILRLSDGENVTLLERLGDLQRSMKERWPKWRATNYFLTGILQQSGIKRSQQLNRRELRYRIQAYLILGLLFGLWLCCGSSMSEMTLGGPIWGQMYRFRWDRFFVAQRSCKHVKMNLRYLIWFWCNWHWKCTENDGFGVFQT